MLSSHPALKLFKRHLARQAHELSHAGGHGTFDILSNHYNVHWEGMRAQAAHTKGTCLLCLRTAVARAEPCHPIVSVAATEPRQILSIDLVGKLVSQDEFHYVLTVVDKFTRNVWLLPMKGASAAEAWIVLNTHVFRTGYPKIIQTDNGSLFVSREFQQNCKMARITHQHTATRVPCFAVERAVQEWKKILKKEFNGTASFSHYLPRIERACNSRVNRMTGAAPFVLETGRPASCITRPETPVLRSEGTRRTRSGTQSHDQRELTAADTFAQEMEARWKTAVFQQTQANGVMAEQFAKRIAERRYHKGDWVLYKEDVRKATGLYVQWSGPWEIERLTMGSSLAKTKVDLTHVRDPRYTVSNVDTRNIFPIPLKLLDETHMNHDELPEACTFYDKDVHYPVQKVLARRYRPGRGEWGLVKWFGHSILTWEPLSELEGPVLHRFYARQRWLWQRESQSTEDQGTQTGPTAPTTPPPSACQAKRKFSDLAAEILGPILEPTIRPRVRVDTGSMAVATEYMRSKRESERRKRKRQRRRR